MSTDVEHIEATAGHHDSGSFGHDHVHQGLSDRQYIVVALILAAITALEVSLTYLDVGVFFLPALLILMVIKFFTVVLYFMHIKFDNKLFGTLFYMGLGLAVTVYVAALMTFHFFSS